MRLGELLLKEGLLTAEQLRLAMERQKASGGTLAAALGELGLLKDEDITGVLSRQFGVAAVDGDSLAPEPAVTQMIPATTARKYGIMPLRYADKVLTIAISDPTNVVAMDDLRFMTGYRVQPLVASERAIREAIERSYGPVPSRERGTPSPRSLQETMEPPSLTADDLASAGGLSDIEDLDSLADYEPDAASSRSEEKEIDLADRTRAGPAPIVKLINVLFLDSLKRRASHIHVEPYEREFRLRFRIDGVLFNVMALPLKLRDPVTSRIKTMAHMDLAEKRLPQDGLIKLRLKVEDRSGELTFRVAVRPTAWGETIVLRLVDTSRLILDLTRLGLEPHSLERFKSALAMPGGMVLVTGPRASGKTNTLYSALASLNRPDVQIVTAERQFECSLPGINQVQVRPGAGLNSAAVLRAIAGMAADIVMLDEIGDGEAAREVVGLAQRGHLVLSTLPTCDAPSSVGCLLAWGVEPSFLAGTLNLVLAQRLVRRICDACKVDDTASVPSDTLFAIGFARESIGSFPVMKGAGCPACNGTGYRGQVGLFEVMEVSPAIADLIAVHAVARELRRRALMEGMLTLRMSGLEKVRLGITTIDEVLRETVL